MFQIQKNRRTNPAKISETKQLQVVEAIEDLLRRRDVAVLAARGYTANKIAKTLGMSPTTVRKVMDTSLARLHDREYERRNPGERFEGAVSGEVLPPSDQVKLAKDAFELKRRAFPYPKIAQMLNISETRAKQLVREYLKSLEDDELQSTDLARRMQIEQIDAMIRTLTPLATGERGDPLGEDDEFAVRRPDYLAVDRMLKLLDQKGKLLGLNAPQRVDILHRIEEIAREEQYDLEELKDIAQQVLDRRAQERIVG